MRQDYNPASRVKVSLKGALGEKFGTEPKELCVSTAREAIDALIATVPGFGLEVKRLTSEGIGYQIITPRFPEGMEENDLYKSCGDELWVVPVVEGSGAAARIIGGAVLIGVGAVTGFTPALLAGASLALGGISQLLTPRVRPPNDPEREKKEIKSSSFNTVTGTADRDHPIPLLYGFDRITLAPVLSSGVSTEQIEIES
jgi:predicted phage tail protein